MGDGMLMCYIYLFAYTISALKLSAVVMSGQKLYQGRWLLDLPSSCPSTHALATNSSGRETRNSSVQKIEITIYGLSRSGLFVAVYLQ